MNHRNLTLLRARHDDESGAILILSVLFLVVMIVACAVTSLNPDSSTATSRLPVGVGT